MRERARFQAIWDALTTEFGAEFPEAVRARHTPTDEVELRECERCGLGWFQPLVMGDAEFYARLMRAMAYEETRWEFEVVAARVGQSETVADFGCGSGAFLRCLDGRVRDRVGIDHNEEAAATLRSLGAEAFVGSFADFARRNEGRFDVACGFQVLEHMAAVDDLMDPMVRVLRPGGRIFLSVPNEDRTGKRSFEPLDWPPHHASRWHTDQLTILADRFRLDMCGVSLEPPPFSEVAGLARRPLERVLRAVSTPRPKRVLLAAWRRMLIGPRRYRWAVEHGIFRRRGMHGHTILVELRRPVH